MRASTIREGDLLKLKPGIYPPEYQIIQVARMECRNGYKTPWIFTATGEAFQPRDFSRHATREEIL